MTKLLVTLAGVLALVVACTQSATRSTDDDDGGPSGAGAQGAGVPQNGAGAMGGTTMGSGGNAADYPAGPYGILVANTVENFQVTGYPSSSAPEIVPLPLALFYNPTGIASYAPTDPLTGAKPQVLVVVLCAVWAGPCQQTATTMNGEYAIHNPNGAEFLMVLFDGTAPGTPATTTDLNDWVASFAPSYPTGIMPTAPAMLEAVPTVLAVDARDMTVQVSQIGVPDAGFWNQLAGLL